MHFMLPIAQEPGSSLGAFWIGVAVIVILIFLVVVILVANFIGLYVRAYFSGARVSFFELFGMRMRKVNAPVIVIWPHSGHAGRAAG